MEDEKKKKKNKKKKNKQTKTTGDVTHGIGESGNADQNHAIEQNHHNQLSESTIVQNDVQATDVDLDRCQANGTEGVVAEADKLYWMDREASLEETIKKLQKENDTRIQKEANFEEAIKKLQKENDTHIQEEASLEETIKQLKKENDTHMQKEASLERKLVRLQGEKDFWHQKEVGFEEKINQLIDETATLSLKGVGLEEKIKQLEGERDYWVQKEVGLEDKIKQLEGERDYWVQKENSTNETIAKLNGDNSRLQAQVMELEESRNNLLQENQQLTENMFGLQYQIQNLETASTRTSTVMTMHASGSEDMNIQMEAAQQFVEKLVAENAELVEKVNELYVELERRGVTTDPSPAVGSEPTVRTIETVRVHDPMSEFSEQTSSSGEKMNSHEDILIKDDNVNSKGTICVADSMSGLNETDSLSGLNEMTSISIERVESSEDVAIIHEMVESPEDVAINHEGEGGQYSHYAKETTVVPNSPKAMDSEEIVQIPLDENEGRDPGLQATHDDTNTDVPLTDAPLIGAPFRLISFFARYVSGADLVNSDN